ncbi:MAG: hypothetical protein AB7L90_13975 [Hyphomicrobiaceae bacterium]
MNRKMIISLVASALALGLSSAAVTASEASAGVFSTLSETAPRSVFDDLNASAPRSPFDEIATSAPKSIFDDLRESAPRASGVFTDLGDQAP